MSKRGCRSIDSQKNDGAHNVIDHDSDVVVFLNISRNISKFHNLDCGVFVATWPTADHKGGKK